MVTTPHPDCSVGTGESHSRHTFVTYDDDRNDVIVTCPGFDEEAALVDLEAARADQAAAGETGLVRTVMTVEILGNTPFTGDLEDVADACVDGEFSGQVTSQVHEHVDATTMAKLLKDQGSAPSFLGLARTGEDTYTLIPEDEQDAVVCVHGKRVWSAATCYQC